MDLSGLGPEEAAAFRARLAAAAAATAAYMDGRASEDLFGYYASLSRLTRRPGDVEAAGARAGEELLKAVRRYADAIRANPRDRIVADRWRSLEAVRLLNQARALLAGGRPGEAADAYREAADVGAPWNRDEAWTGLGRALLREGKPVAAREALERALALYPGSRDAQAFLGEALVALGRPAEARPWFARAYEGGIGPSDEDPPTAAARAAAARAEGAAGGAAPVDGDRELRASLAEALDDAAGARGPRRDRAVARLRAAKGREAELLHALLDPAAKAAADAARPPVERVRALALLGAAGDPRVGAAALATAGDPRSDAALASAAVDAAAEGGGAEALAPLLDPAKVAASAVRARAADRLPGRHEARAVEAALGALGDPDASVRTSALAALFQLTGKKEFDPAAPEPERREALARLRDWWSSARSSWR